MRRLKNTEGKNKDQLEAIKDQGKKQLNAIQKQKENKLKPIEKDKIVHLKHKIDKLFEIYPSSFNKQNKSSLKTFAKNENKINCKNLSNKVLLPDTKFYEIVFFEKIWHFI